MILLNSSPNPIALYDGTTITFINDAFRQLFDSDTLKNIENETVKIEEFFQKMRGYINSIEEFFSDKEHKKVLMRHGNHKHMFSVYTKELTLRPDKKTYRVIYFYDITRLEYYNIKISNYNRYLESLLYEKIYRNRFNKQNKDIQPEAKKIDEYDAKESILRKKKATITSAKEYLGEVDENMNENIAELSEIIEELKIDTYELTETLRKEHLQKITENLLKASKAISVLVEFEDLTYSLYEISELLNKNEIDSAKLPKIAKYLDGFVSEVENWKNSVLVEKSAIDIHYLDASIFSSFLQLEMLLTGHTEHLDDDFTLF